MVSEEQELQKAYERASFVLRVIKNVINLSKL